MVILIEIMLINCQCFRMRGEGRVPALFCVLRRLRIRQLSLLLLPEEQNVKTRKTRPPRLRIFQPSQLALLKVAIIHLLLVSQHVLGLERQAPSSGSSAVPASPAPAQVEP